MNNLQAGHISFSSNGYDSTINLLLVPEYANDGSIDIHYQPVLPT